MVNEAGGTAFRNRLAEVTYAGKTGTAQVVGRRGDKAADTSKYEHRDHALFVAYAPAAAPEIAVAVVVEHGGHGGSAAAPIAKAIFEAYFGIERKTPPVVTVAEETAGTPSAAQSDDSAEGADQLAEQETETAPLPETLQVPPVPPATEDEPVDPAIAPHILDPGPAAEP